MPNIFDDWAVLLDCLTFPRRVDLKASTSIEPVG